MTKKTVKTRRGKKMRGGAVPTKVDEIIDSTTPQEIAQFLINSGVFLPDQSINAPDKLLVNDIERDIELLPLDAKKTFIGYFIKMASQVTLNNFKTKLNSAVKSLSATNVAPSSSSASSSTVSSSSGPPSSSSPSTSTNLFTSSASKPSLAKLNVPSEMTYKCTRISGGRRRKSKKRSKKSKAKTRRH
jgi:hypothetical protein